MEQQYKYYVVVNDPAHKTGVFNELTTDISTTYVPDRIVTCTDFLHYAEHSGLYLLTETEAATLKNDPRVLDVHRIPEEVGIIKKHFGIRHGNYERSTIAPNISDKNWGLVRHINQPNIWGVSSTTNAAYTYNLDGTGVDIIVMDTGVEKYHPELSVNADGTGGSRVIDIDWTKYGSITSVPTGGFLGDCDGHGSNIASIIAGNTCGWAPNAQIYSLRVVGTGAATEHDITDNRVLGLVDELQAWSTIKSFHLSKTANTATGYVRSTIVNCSYGYQTQYSVVRSINYRGTLHSVTTTTSTYGTIGVNVDSTLGGIHGSRVSSVDVAVQSAIAAGVIVVGAAGNTAHKIDISSGPDYNNYWIDNLSNVYYYHQGSSPGATTGVICVGCISATASSTGTEHRKNFSCAGPRVNIWAAGDQIMGAWSNTAYYGPAVYDPRSTASTSSGNFYLQKISGTSQATPQVAGVLALTLGLRPWMTPAQALNYTTATSTLWAADENYYYNTAYGNSGTNYDNWASLLGGNPFLLYQRFNNSSTMILS
jgi:Subtilase family